MQPKTASGNFLLAIFLLAGLAIACGHREYREHVIERAPFRCVHKTGISETYGKDHSFDLGRKIFINGKEYYPEGYYNFDYDIVSCGLSPNPDVILMEFRSVSYERHGYYILRMENDKPKFTKISDDTGDTGCWTNDGRWLLFENYFINAETYEKKSIKPLPSYPACKHSLVAISPDMKTVVQRVSLANQNEDEKKDIITLIVTDTETGETKEERFKLSEYRWLMEVENTLSDYTGAEHLPISKQFKWEKDAKGKDVFVYPKPLANKNIF